MSGLIEEPHRGLPFVATAVSGVTVGVTVLFDPAKCGLRALLWGPSGNLAEHYVRSLFSTGIKHHQLVRRGFCPSADLRHLAVNMLHLLNTLDLEGVVIGAGPTVCLRWAPWPCQPHVWKTDAADGRNSALLGNHRETVVSWHLQGNHPFRVCQVVQDIGPSTVWACLILRVSSFFGRGSRSFISDTMRGTLSCFDQRLSKGGHS